MKFSKETIRICVDSKDHAKIAYNNTKSAGILLNQWIMEIFKRFWHVHDITVNTQAIY
jgi:hypothetical protein